MAIRSKPEVRITLDVQGQRAVIVFNPPSTEDLVAFRDGRFSIGKHGKRTVERAEKLLDFGKRQLKEIENAEYLNHDETWLPLNSQVRLSDDDKQRLSIGYRRPIEDWRDLVNPQWIMDAASEAFEETPAEIEAKKG